MPESIDNLPPDLESNSPSDSGRDAADAWRIIDANANRVVEGLRVTEDYLRFYREDGFLAQACKQIRHQVSETLAGFGRQRLACRSTETDIGTEVETATEYQRINLQHVAIANLRRACEGLRTLEEFSKVLSLSMAKKFESLRYQTYTLEKSLGHLEHSAESLQAANVYVIVDLTYGVGDEFAARVRHMIAAGAGAIQLRDKSAEDRDLVVAGHRLRELVLESTGLESTTTRPLLIINDRPDIARVVHADGVHVGQDELSVADARVVIGPHALIGVSTHSLDQAKQAIVDGADYIGVGPVFKSSTKSFEKFVGLDLLKEVSAEIALPAYAIGGITPARLGDVLDSGFLRVAVSDAIWGATDIAAATTVFKTKLTQDEPT